MFSGGKVMKAVLEVTGKILKQKTSKMKPLSHNFTHNFEGLTRYNIRYWNLGKFR